MRIKPDKFRVENHWRLASMVMVFFVAFPLGLRAGDILRGGSSMSSSTRNAEARAAAGEAAAAMAKQNAVDRLARTTQALAAVKAMQNAARGARAGNNLGQNPNFPGQMLPDVPNGLGVGGLDIDGTPTGANAPTQSSDGGNTKVTVKQNEQQAMLYWKTFNIGGKTTLFFDQSAGGSDVGKWIAFNKITDPSGAPSQIMGSIRAAGQVYVINQNGIIFGGGSQVNVHALVASSLPINDNLVNSGILINPDLQFLFSAFDIAAGTKGTPAFTAPPPPSILNGKRGDVTVQRGAVITSPTSASKAGGRVTLVGPNVTNAGTISTPDGQTILAAGLEVGLDSHPSNDPSLRGLDVYIGRVTDGVTTGGVAKNTGLIEAPRGNITIAGKEVGQLGFLNSSTSVSLNGRIDLLANYDAVSNAGYNAEDASTGRPFLSNSTGLVTFGANSVMQIIPEIWSSDQVAGTKLPLTSRINVQGLAIHMGPNAVLLAPNAEVAFKAGAWKFGGSATLPTSTFVYTKGQIYIDRGALIDVAGTTGVSAPISQNILELEVRGGELANSPLQRDGAVRGSSIIIDIRKTGTWNGFNWVGTPLGDASGYVGLIQRSVDQLTTAGGTVSLNAGDSVVLQQGATIDVSGGWINYEAGMVKTTRLLANGQIINIDDATPDRVYDGIFTSKFFTTSSKWGVTKVFGHPLAPTGEHYEQSYIQGADAGAISITAPSMALDGQLVARTVVGPRQLRDSSTSSAIAKLGSLTLSFQAQDASYTSDQLPFYSPYTPLLTFGTETLGAVAAFALDINGDPLELEDRRKGKVVLSPDLFGEGGFGNLTIDNRDGNVEIPGGLTLVLPDGGSLAVKGANIDLLGSVIAPSGSLTFEAYNLSQVVLNAIASDSSLPAPPADPNRGILTLSTASVLSTAGLIVDDRPTALQDRLKLMAINGGSINLSAYHANLAEGSVIDVSGGVIMTAAGKRVYGDGGAISIKGGQDPGAAYNIGGSLVLGSKLMGYSGDDAGSLTIQAPLIRVSNGGTNSVNGNTFSVSPEFFNQGGFGSFTLIGVGIVGSQPDNLPAVMIDPGTIIEPVALGWLATSHTQGGNGISLSTILRPEGIRTPVSLSFIGKGVSSRGVVAQGDVVIGEGARISTDAGASVILQGETVSVFGSIFAPSGYIEVTGKSSYPGTDPSSALAALPTVHLAKGSILSTAGKTLLMPDAYGRRTGYVLPGGVISVSGNIVAEAGATLDVSGTSGILDLSPAVAGLLTASEIPVNSGVTTQPFSVRSVATRVDSDGGTIILEGSEELFVDANLIGHAGGPTALGGALMVSSGRFLPGGLAGPASDPNLIVTQNGQSIPSSSPVGVGQAVRDENGNFMPGMGYFAVDLFEKGGFDTLALGGKVSFVGPIDIQARNSLFIADGGFIWADSDVNLTAPYVALGTSFYGPQLEEEKVPVFGNYVPPTFGPGSLTVNARTIDIGNLSLQNIGKAALNAFNGDIRGDGTLNIAGDLTLVAGQIYPASATSFTIVAYDYLLGGLTQPGSVTILGSGSRQLPMSAGGELNIYGSIINQSGVLRAPMGSINLGWDGTGAAPVDWATGTSLPFPVTQQLTLGAGSITSVSAVDPVTGKGMLIPYGISPDGLTWIDPSGVDITAGGVPQKSIKLAGANVSLEAGSQIDISGGGDLYAYRWVAGNGGTVDILKSTGSFAVIPGYQANYSPAASFNTRPTGSKLNGDPGYVNDELAVGDRIYLAASDGLAAGVYTLLPARYALLPGAVLVTPKSGEPTGSFDMPDGSSIVSGYRFNDLNSERTLSGLYSKFEVAPASVIRSRAEYQDFFASAFLRDSALAVDATVPRLPQDAGSLVLQATQSLNILGSVIAGGAVGGRGGLVDIASPVDILIGRSGTAVGPGVLFLDAAQLSGFGAESLLVGGVRSAGTDGTTLSVLTNHLTVDNVGSALAASEVILAAKQSLTLAPDAEVESTGSLSESAETLHLVGDGTLLRVSGDPSAQIVRTGVTTSAVPTMSIGAGARIAGSSIILDSTYATSLDPSAILDGEAISLNSGQISLVLDNPGALLPTNGMVLAGPALQGLQSANSLSLLSYSSIDIYGTGTLTTTGSLAFHAPQIRGFNSGTVSFSASHIQLDNSPNRTALATPNAPSGTLDFNADTISIGANQLRVDQYADVNMNATDGVQVQGSGGLSVQGNLTLNTPLLTASAKAKQALTAGGALEILSTGGEGTGGSGLGATLTLKGASVNSTSRIFLPSGLLTLHATTENVSVGGQLDVSGTAQSFFDVVKYTDGGEIRLIADAGSVNVDANGALNVAAKSGGGNAGSLSVETPSGNLVMDGTLFGQAGTGGQSGVFSLDVGTLPGLASLNSKLNDAAFEQSRSIRVRNGNVLVDGLATVRHFDLSADQGSITVTGTIDASGETGGTISLAANGSVILSSGSLLDVSAEKFSNAGKGGQVTLEAGSQHNGTIGTGSVDIQSGSTIDLSVDSKIAGSAALEGTSAYNGQFSGKLHIRAPQFAAGNELKVEAINGAILDASSILVEGFKLYDLTATGGAITIAVQNSIASNGQTFLGAAGTTTANYTAMTNRLLANNGSLASVFVLAPGAEIINRTGDLTLGTTASTSTSDWNLGASNFRFGAKSAPGVLTMKAAGNLVFYNALSDGFATSAHTSLLLGQSATLPINTQSWSYRLTAGADLGAADFARVASTDSLASTAGFLKLGKNFGVNSSGFGGGALTSTAIANRFQVIRTGSGDIDIHTGRSVQLLNHFATIYTAGTRVADYTMGGTFTVPQMAQSLQDGYGLGVAQQTPTYAVQYTMAGGNVMLSAQQNIEHLTQNSSGVLIADSQRELPNNWLYRRGYVDPATGLFGTRTPVSTNVSSTSWWVDFSNFFEGVGALGGGDVTLLAGSDIGNVDAVIPTNARMKGRNGTAILAPAAANLLELGGGDLLVRSGRNIDAGIYYVERGKGQLAAGGDIITNKTRSPSATVLDNTPELVSETWLPTTLFLGKGGFDVSARGNVLLGPVGNVFLLPQSLNNTLVYKTYFSTYSPESYVNVSSLGGTLTLRNGAADPRLPGGDSRTTPLLQAWANQQLLNAASAAYYQPWLRLIETSVAPFGTALSLLPPTLQATAFSGDINLAGNLTLSPSATGTLDLLAGGAINGFQPVGSRNLSGSTVEYRAWATSHVNLSDANPASLPGVISPFGYQALVGSNTGSLAVTQGNFLNFVDVLFKETGSTQGNVQTKRALHASGLLHTGDADPVRLYAANGNLSGLTFYSPKQARIIASRDITDIALYLQNLTDSDASVVAAGRDIVAYNSNTPLRAAAALSGNATISTSGPLAGDIQINGPGALEVLAGRNLDLGVGSNNANGTGIGITSIGNARNPFLPFEGASLFVGAGIGPSTGLDGSTMDFDSFIADFLEGDSKYVSEVEAGDFESLPADARNRIALEVFYLVLRDAGRTGDFETGYHAIETLFPNATGGDIATRSRDIRTKSGGGISIFAPAGKLTLANTTIGSTFAPPGIVTESGGSIGIFTEGDVDIGIGRIFTLKGGNEIIWSTSGDIAAGSSAKTVQSAPPTRVIIDPQSAEVQTDLAGLATGGGIGVLATVAGVEPGDVDLIAPQGSIDAGDAGIRSTGNITLAAVTVLNASNISAGGTTSGAPATGPAASAAPPAAPASNSAAVNANQANDMANQNANKSAQEEDEPSMITVEVLGYGGGDGQDDEEEEQQGAG